MGAIADLLAGGLGNLGPRRSVPVFGRGYGLVLAVVAILTAVLAFRMAFEFDEGVLWVPFVIAFGAGSICGLALGRGVSLSALGGLAACLGPCVGSVAGIFFGILHLWSCLPGWGGEDC